MRSRTLLVGIAACLLLLGSSCVVAEDSLAAAVSPDVALARLKTGNARFVAAPVSEGKPTAARRVETAHAQHPIAIIVGCADSRTSPELVFDQNIGDLFVVRTAGNLVGGRATQPVLDGHVPARYQHRLRPCGARGQKRQGH